MISVKDYRLALEVSHEVITSSPAAAGVLGGLQRLVGADCVSVITFNLRTSQIVQGTGQRAEFQDLLETPAFRESTRHHPVLAAVRSGRLTPGGMVTTSDLIDARGARNNPLLSDWYQPNGVRDQLLVSVHARRERATTLGFARSRRGFSNRDRAAAALVVPQLSHSFARLDRPAEPPRPAALGELSPREREVAGLVARAFTDRQVARALQISERTVHKHLQNIYRKTGLRSRAQLLVVHDGPG